MRRGDGERRQAPRRPHRPIAQSLCHPPPTKCTISSLSPGLNSISAHFARGRIDRFNSIASRSDASSSCLIKSVTRALRLRSEEHTSELQSLRHLVCRLLLEKKSSRVTEL